MSARGDGDGGPASPGNPADSYMPEEKSRRPKGESGTLLYRQHFVFPAVLSISYIYVRVLLTTPSGLLSEVCLPHRSQAQCFLIQNCTGEGHSGCGSAGSTRSRVGETCVCGTPPFPVLIAIFGVVGVLESALQVYFGWETRDSTRG